MPPSSFEIVDDVTEHPKMAEDGRDQTYPLKLVQEVLCWYPERAGRKACPLKERGPRYKLKTVEDEKNASFDFVKCDSVRPQVMVCHDMRGGYLEDRFFDGCKEISDEPYRFVHWAMIDTWIYFSHNFITIPPFGWIQAAHRNGVRVLGTIITEWDDGKGLCHQFLLDDDVMMKFAGKCAQIAHDVGFEGWLLNIENPLEPDQVPRMKGFVRALTEEMRRVNPSNSQVVWYDSVTKEGKLSWQNELNGQNYSFFELCDGIFTNYNWRVDDEKNSIENSLATLEEHKASAGRNLDIFFGVDVFGRGTYGGGGFNSCKAFEAVQGRTSMAIFAPGWTHENKEEGKNFVQREYKFWELLQPYVTFSSVKVDCDDDDSSCWTFNNGVSIEDDSRWSMDYNAENLMPPIYSLGSDSPFLLSHYLDHAECGSLTTKDCNKGLAIAKTGNKPWKWFGKHLGVENIVPVLLCNVPVSGAEKIEVTMTMTHHRLSGPPTTKWPDVYARYYMPGGDETTVIEKLECVKTEEHHAVYELCFRQKAAAFVMDCLAVEACLTLPDFSVLKQCGMRLISSKQ